MATILIVDDHPHVVRLLQFELAAVAQVVLTAASGEEALRQARQERPDLVVLDVMLPGKDGLQVLRDLKADPATQAIRVILLTAKALPDEVAHGLALGADWYATKPFHPGDIAGLARRFLEAGPPQAPGEPVPGLPLGEIDRLTRAAAEAFQLAAAGAVAEGYDCLAAGLQRASAARAAGQPWAAELAEQYEELRDHYLGRYDEARGCLAAAGSR